MTSAQLANLQQESAQLKSQLRALTRNLRSDRLTAEQWQAQFLAGLRAAHLRAAVLAAGGTVVPATQQIVDEVLSEELDYFKGFAHDLIAIDRYNNQNVYRYNPLDRAGLYADALKLTYSRVEIFTRQQQGYTQALRRTNSTARSCKECLAYETHGWIRIDQVMPIGHRCHCRNRCQCVILFRR